MQVGCTHDDATGQGRGRPASDMLISSAMLMVEWLGPLTTYLQLVQLLRQPCRGSIRPAHALLQVLCGVARRLLVFWCCRRSRLSSTESAYGGCPPEL